FYISTFSLLISNKLILLSYFHFEQFISELLFLHSTMVRCCSLEYQDVIPLYDSIHCRKCGNQVAHIHDYIRMVWPRGIFNRLKREFSSRTIWNYRSQCQLYRIWRVNRVENYCSHPTEHVC
ncbi:hypothetical protein AABB24_032022, partial [Solanum stoloniferum]